MDTIINELLRKDKWDEIMKMIENGDIKDLDQEIVNGNSIYHFACIKGKIEFIKRLMELKNKGKINISFHLPNGNGLVGIELYYKYGGNDSYLLKNQDICYVNDNGMHFSRYVVYDIDLLEILFENMIKIGCLNNIDTLNIDYILIIIMEQIIRYSDTNDPDNKNKDDDKKNRYIGIIKILSDIIDKFDIAYSAINTNCIDVIYLLIDEYRYDFSEINNIDKGISRKWSYMGRGVEGLVENGETFMNYMVLANRIQMCMIILTYTYKVFGCNALIRLVTESGTDFSFRPIFLAINNNVPILNVIVGALEMCIGKDYLFTETDLSRNTYLHYVLGIINKNDFKDFKPEIIEFFINHTDLDAENYAGVTPAHLLFSKGLWKQFKHALKNRRIDLLKIDDVGKNCYSYVDSDETSEFIELTKNIKIPLDEDAVHRSKQKINIRDMIIVEKKANNDTKSSGLFGGNWQYYMIYLWYLKNKFSSLYIPTQVYDKNDFDMEWFVFDTCSKFPLSPNENILNKFIKYYFALCYSYLPHVMFWTGDDCYYINNNLWRILEKHNQNVSVNNQRYVMIKITLGISADTSFHANVLLYDRLKKEAWRFEPYGTSKIMRNMALDNLLYDQLKIVYGNDVKYYGPDDYLEGINFQLVSEGMGISRKNLGDPLGYCLAWSLWFVDVVLSHPDMNPKDIVHNLFTKKDINEIISEEEGEPIDSSNYYLDFIRRYAKKLDTEKNKILQSWGVKKYYMYNNVFNNDITNIMKEKFTIT